MVTYIEKKILIDGLEVAVNFGNLSDEILLGPIVEKFIQKFNNLSGLKLRYFWIDLGKSVYDIHIETSVEGSDEYEDAYLNLSDDNKNIIGVYFSTGVNFNEALGVELTKKFIAAVLKYKATEEKLVTVCISNEELEVLNYFKDYDLAENALKQLVDDKHIFLESDDKRVDTIAKNDTIVQMRRELTFDKEVVSYDKILCSPQVLVQN